MKKKLRCSNCGQPIGKIGVMCPSIDKKKRNMCIPCAEKLILKKKKPLTIEEIEREFDELHIRPDGSVPGKWIEIASLIKTDKEAECDACGVKFKTFVEPPLSFSVTTKYFRTSNAGRHCYTCEMGLRPKRIKIRNNEIKSFYRQHIKDVLEGLRMEECEIIGTDNPTYESRIEQAIYNRIAQEINQKIDAILKGEK